LRAGLLGLRVLRRRGLRDTESRRGEAHDQDAENLHRELDKKTPHVYLKEVPVGNRLLANLSKSSSGSCAMLKDR
jgi:hypothetical protein